MSEHEEPVAERAVKGALHGYVAAKGVQWSVRLKMWALPIVLLLVYGAVAWWRARRALMAGALDDEALARGEVPPSRIARDEGVLDWISSTRLQADQG